MNELKRTALYEEHLKANAKMVPFAGFEMPVNYPEGMMEEHKAVRTVAGLFDVSHMGQFIITGPDAENFVNYIITNNVKKITDYSALYTAMCYEQGTIVDDLLVYKFPEYFMLVVNAANIEKDLTHINEHAKDKNFRVNIENKSDQYSLIAFQGPKTEEILSKYSEIDLSKIKYYQFTIGKILDKEVIISRTGYTGEDGFELYIKDPEHTKKIWSTLYEENKEKGVKLCGLGARDTLRLEMGFALYGNDIDETTTPLEAGLNWVVKLKKKDDFIGKEALIKQKEEGLKRKLFAFEYPDKLIPRHNYPIVNSEDKEIGNVTSGCFSPMLEKSIGMGYIYLDKFNENDIFIKVRNKKIKATITKLPFYKKATHK